MCWQIMIIYQMILDLTSRKFILYILIIAIAPGREKNQLCRTDNFRKPQVNRDARWKPITE